MGRRLAPRALPARDRPKYGPRGREMPRRLVVYFMAPCRQASRRVFRGPRVSKDPGGSPPLSADGTPSTVATPGQAGLPAEFKHINKRRKRNLQGFP